MAGASRIFAFLITGIVIPSVGVEGVFKHGRPEYKGHLASAHARLELCEHLTGDKVALINVDFEHTWKLKLTASSAAKPKY